MTVAAVGAYLFGRILKDGKDSRFDAIKKDPPTFFAVWMAQAMWVALLLMPVVTLNAAPAAAFAGLPAVAVTDVVGLGLFATGLAVEVVADAQKSRWVHDKKAKLHDEQFMTSGLWQRR